MTTSTSMTEGKAARVEVSTSTLLRLIGDAKAFASRDDYIPAINCVTFEFAGEDLIAVATDRYTLGASRLPIGRAIVQPPRVLRLSEIDRIEKAFRPARGTDPALALEFGDESLGIETTATLDGLPTHREAFPWSPENTRTVDWRKLIAPVRGLEVGPTNASFNPEFLAKFVAVQHDKGAPIVVWPTFPDKPWRVTVGDTFTGLIMPVTRTNDASGREWIPAAVNTAPEPKRRASRATKKAAA